MKPGPPGPQLKNMLNKLLLFLGLILLFSACDQGAEYQRMVKRELASGEKHDSLFLGIHFGMDSRTFYTHCWELNHQGLIKEGPDNGSVEYPLGELKHPGKMYFYPDFSEDQIHKMRLIFTYDGWAPWNKNMKADSLEQDVLSIFKRWYGGRDFMELRSKKGNSVYVKVDGNRRISVWKEDDMKVRALFKDLSVDKSAKKENSGVLD